MNIKYPEGSLIGPAKDLHKTYCRLTGLDVPQSPDSERIWFDWIHWSRQYDDKVPQWGLPQLEAVIAHMKKQPDRWKMASFRLRNLIGRPEEFAEVLAEARAAARRKALPRAKAEVLRATGRDDQPQQEGPTTSKEVIQGWIEKMKEAAK